MTSSVCAADLLKEWNHERNLLRGTRLFSAWHHMSSFSILLCGILFLLLPRDNYGTIIQLAILLLVVGSLLFWIGFLART